MRSFLFLFAFAAALLTIGSSKALESYPAEIADQFLSWCTRAQNQTPTVCSCAANKAATEIPAAAMASFLNAAEGGGMATTAKGVGATALSIVSTCASGGGTTDGSLLKSPGKSMGQ